MNLPDAQPSPPAAPDRRHYPRYTVQVQIEIHQDGKDAPMRLETTDLSRGGCYIEMQMQLSIGVRVRATLWLDGCPIVVQAVVVTRHPQFGNGIMFVEFEGQGEQRLHRYLDAIPPKCCVP
jgi:c-di-GMP-binding flagellar brake protein YcgR